MGNCPDTDIDPKSVGSYPTPLQVIQAQISRNSKIKLEF